MTLPMAEASALTRWRFAAGCVLLAGLGFFPFVRGTRVPVLGWIDLAVHEFGHLATGMLPDVVTAVMGNGSQTAVPLALAVVFGWRERDWLGVVLCLGWAAATLQDASTYIGDAPYQQLQLIGGYHDWAFALGEVGLVGQAGLLARVVWSSGLLLWAIALAGAAAGPWIEPLLREHGVPGLVAHALGWSQGRRPRAEPEVPSWAAVAAAAAWDEFYRRTPERRGRKGSSLS